MLPYSLSNPVFTPFQNKTPSPHNRKTRTAIFAYFRKRSFSAPKTHNFCQLTKTHDFHNLHHNICISPNPEFEFPEETFCPEKSDVFLVGNYPQYSHVLQNGKSETVRKCPDIGDSSKHEMVMLLAIFVDEQTYFHENDFPEYVFL